MGKTSYSLKPRKKRPQKHQHFWHIMPEIAPFLTVIAMKISQKSPKNFLSSKKEKRAQKRGGLSDFGRKQSDFCPQQSDFCPKQSDFCPGHFPETRMNTGFAGPSKNCKSLKTLKSLKSVKSPVLDRPDFFFYPIKRRSSQNQAFISLQGQAYPQPSRLQGKRPAGRGSPG